MTPKWSSGSIWVGVMFVVLSCRPPGAGWDLDALMAAEPSIVGLEGQRLAALLPFPVLDGDRIGLVACRFAREQSVRVRGGGPQWPSLWGRAAVRALALGLRQVDLVLEGVETGVAQGEPNIEIIMIEAVGGAGPRGLGDTLSECDVSPIVSTTAGASRAVRGLLTGAEIRMRRAQLDNTGQIRDASAEEWVGALMHELAHALGFIGHVATGHSILVRDETRIRAAGRRALSGEAVPDPTLDALYLLQPGQWLGSRRVRAEGMSWLQAMRDFNRQRPEKFGTSVATFSSVGDTEARIVLRYSDGSQLGIRLPYWRNELRSGAGITLRPDRMTRRLLAGEAVALD